MCSIIYIFTVPWCIVLFRNIPNFHTQSFLHLYVYSAAWSDRWSSWNINIIKLLRPNAKTNINFFIKNISECMMMFLYLEYCMKKAHINTHPISSSTTRTRTRTRHAALEGPYVLDTLSYSRHPKPARVCQNKTFYFIRMV